MSGRPPFVDESRLESVVARFDLRGEVFRAEQLTAGHIHETWRVDVRNPDGATAVVVQRINRRVFPNPDAVMRNIGTVTRHLARKVWDRPDARRRVLTPIPARDGGLAVVDDTGEWWRAFFFIYGASTFDAVSDPSISRAAAAAFGRFLADLSDLPPDDVEETIPRFHDTPARFEALMQAVQQDPLNRANRVRREIEFFIARESDTKRLADLQRSGTLPMRVVHNDCKINNVMIDNRTGEGLCVIDLDTVMRGLALYDFGDLVRTASCPAAEDEKDPSRIRVDETCFRAIAEGYLSGAGDVLVDAEVDLAVFAGKLITLETAMRFLTDYLLGDVYFRIHRPEHNLDRCRAQCRLVESIEAMESDLCRVVDMIWRAGG
ncbi:MAG: aminoglycoside phosphotransferase family protein [Kiritimatiellae bacterium]|nr:aminoglycoside phosphotransferase family protein [Kiritimatiellia bacterium]MDW8458368.1 aminoglycoside phosphotransferase family protein [Verrucomicrobiota bacterium]